MSTIKIKLKDTLTAPESTINLTILFTSANEDYNNMVFLSTGTLRYQRTGLTTYVYRNGAYDKPECQYIELDPTQRNFNEFITAMKSNIDGVELEAGTYKWVDEPNQDSNLLGNRYNINFNSYYDGGTSNYVQIVFQGGAPSSRGIFYRSTIDTSGFVSNAYYFIDGWQNEGYKTITTTENQYVDYDFYNYAILGNQLVKQGGSGGTNNLKFGTETPSKLYIGNTEVTKAYMGEVLVYEK